jgi:hypothetical protein
MMSQAPPLPQPSFVTGLHASCVSHPTLQLLWWQVVSASTTLGHRGGLAHRGVRDLAHEARQAQGIVAAGDELVAARGHQAGDHGSARRAPTLRRDRCLRSAARSHR